VPRALFQLTLTFVGSIGLICASGRSARKSNRKVLTLLQLTSCDELQQGLRRKADADQAPAEGFD
jgi:hypothetical protein